MGKGSLQSAKKRKEEKGKSIGSGAWRKGWKARFLSSGIFLPWVATGLTQLGMYTEIANPAELVRHGRKDSSTLWKEARQAIPKRCLLREGGLWGTAPFVSCLPAAWAWRNWTKACTVVGCELFRQLLWALITLQFSAQTSSPGPVRPWGRLRGNTAI